MDPFAFDPDETRSGFEGEVGASSDETSDVVASVPPPRARPALRPGALPEARTSGAVPPEERSASGRRRVVSRRMRVRSGGVRRSRLESGSSGDHRAASGRSVPISPPRHEPHPRAISGPPKPQAADGAAGEAPAPGESGEIGRSGRRRRVLSSHGFTAFGRSPGLDEVLGDEPILVVDSLPPRRFFGEDSSRFSLRRTVRLRFDMALAAALVVATLVGSAFYLGRQGSSGGRALVAANAAEGGHGPVALSLGTRGPGLAAAPAPSRREAARPRATRRQAGASREAAPDRRQGGATNGREAARPAPAPVAAAPRVSIMAMRAQRGRSAEVKRFLESHGLKVYLQHVGARTTNVRVGGYASLASAAAKADLTKVRALVFDGKRLTDAYFVPWKPGL